MSFKFQSVPLSLSPVYYYVFNDANGACTIILYVISLEPPTMLDVHFKIM